MATSIYGAPTGFSTAPISVQHTFRISTDLIRMFPSQNFDVRPGGLSLVPYGGSAGNGGCIDITGADQGTVAALGPGAATRDTTGCAERTRRDRNNLDKLYRINPCNFTYRLPFPLEYVQQMTMISFDVSKTYNISPALNNNYLTYYRPGVDGLPDLTDKSAVVVEIPKGNYSSIQNVLTLVNTGLAMGTQGTGFNPQFRVDTLSGRVYFVDTEHDEDDAADGLHGIIDFRHPSLTGAGGSMPGRAVSPPDDHCLGWLLGYRKMVYTAGAPNGALPDMYAKLSNYPNYHGDWPGTMIDGAYVPTTTDGDSEFTPWGYIAEANYDLNDQNLYIAIEDNVSNEVGGYVYSNDGAEASGLNTIVARAPIGSNTEDFAGTPRTFIQPYPTVSRLQIKVFDSKGRQPDFGLNTITMEVQFTTIVPAPAPLPKPSTY
jgi:hypothetical protein